MAVGFVTEISIPVIDTLWSRVKAPHQSGVSTAGDYCPAPEEG